MILTLCRCSLTFPIYGNLLVRESIERVILLIGLLENFNRYSTFLPLLIDYKFDHPLIISLLLRSLKSGAIHSHLAEALLNILNRRGVLLILQKNSYFKITVLIKK